MKRGIAPGVDGALEEGMYEGKMWSRARLGGGFWSWLYGWTEEVVFGVEGQVVGFGLVSLVFTSGSGSNKVSLWGS